VYAAGKMAELADYLGKSDDAVEMREQVLHKAVFLTN